MGTHETSFSAAAVWTQFHKELSGTAWDDDDIDDVVYRRNHDARSAASALKRVYDLPWKNVEAEDGVLAVIKASTEYHGTYFTVSQFEAMARGFRVWHKDIEEPMDDYLQEECGPVRWHWLNEQGRRLVKDAVVRDSEIWVEDVNVGSDIFVFQKPGHS
jgi:hypothetical protein